MRNFLSVEETAIKFKLSNRRVQLLCEQGRIANVEMISGVWLIPIESQKPVDGRTKFSNSVNQLTLFDFSKEIQPDLIPFESVCEELSISSATGRNWVRLGKLVPSLTNGRHLFFKRSDINNIIHSISTGESKALIQRRNKSKIKGSSLCENYIENSHNIMTISNIISAIDTELTDDFLRLLLANFALQLIYQAAGEQQIKGNLIDGYIKKDLHVRKVMPLVDDLLSGVSEMALINRYSDIFDQLLQYESGEDTLGFAYISLVSLGQRKAKGSYYTPFNVVNKLVALLNENDGLCDKTIFDPCCGSGNFLLSIGGFATNHQLLYGQDADLLAVQLARISFSMRFGITDTNFLYSHFTCTDTLLYPPKQTFDIILGNPPWGGEITQEYLKKIINSYATATAHGTETYDLFIEQSLNLLTNNGVLAFVLPEALLNVASHRTVRNLIMKNCNFKFVNYLGNVFNGVHCPCIIMGIEKSEFLVPGVKRIYTKKNEYTLHTNRQISSAHFNFHVQDEIQDCLDALDDGLEKTTLYGKSKFALGIVTGDNATYTSNVCYEGYEPVVKGNDIKKYHVGSGTRYIKFIPQNFQQVAPTEIYRFSEKLLYRFICDSLVFAYDDRQTLSLNSCNILIPQIPGMNIKYVLAILNSRAATFYFTYMFNSFKILRSHIEKIPLPCASPQIQANVVSLVDKIIYCHGNTMDAYQELDDYIMSLYGLNNSQKQTIVTALSGRNLFLV